MEHRDVIQTWWLLLICSSIIKAITFPPTKDSASDSSLFSNPTFIYSAEVEQSLNSVAMSDSSNRPSLPLLEMSNKNSVHGTHFFPPNMSKSPRHLRRPLSENGFDFSGDDEDVDSEDDFNFETTEKDVFESEQFILENTSVPLVPSARMSENTDHSLLRPSESTPDYQTIQTHQSLRNTQGGRMVDARTFLQRPTASSSIDSPVFEVTAHHTVLEKLTDRHIATLGKMGQTSTQIHSATEQRYLLTSSNALEKEEAVVQFEGQPEHTSPSSVPGPSLAQRDQSLIKNEPDESHMTPAPMQSASSLITETDYSLVTGGSSLPARQPSVGVTLQSNQLDFLNVTNASEARSQHNYQHTTNIGENALNLPISSTTEHLEPGMKREMVDQVNPSERSLAVVDSATTTQWLRSPMYDARKSSPAHQITDSYSSSQHGYDIYTQPADNMTTVVKVLQDAQSLDIPKADVDGGLTARNELSTETVTTSPTAGLQHLTMKGFRKGVTSTESTRTDTSTYFFALTAQRHMLSVEVNPVLTSTRNMRAEYTPSGSYMAMLQTKSTVLPQRLTAKVSNKTHIPTTQQPAVGTKWTATNLSLPRTTSRALSPTPRPTKVFQTQTSTVKGTVTVKTTPPVTGKPGTHHNIMTTTMDGKSGNNRQSPTTMIAVNTSTGVNTSSKGQDSQHGSERENIRLVNARKPDHTSNSKPTVDNSSDEYKSYSRLCSTWDRECIANKTSAQWNDLKQTLGFAWEMHVYGAGILFVILMLMSLINLIGSPILYIPDLSYLMAANAQLFALGLLRAIYLFLDPYGSKSKLPPVGSLVLYNITLPLLITTFGILTLMLLKMGKLQMLSSNIQSPAFLAVIAVIHFVILLSGDLLYLLLNPAVNIILHIFSVSWGSFLIFAFFLICRKLKIQSEATVGQIQQSTVHNEESIDLQNPERALKQLLIFTRVMAIGGVFGLLCCALQVYAILWMYGILGEKGHFYWSWWFLQFWYRCFEIVISFAMCFVTSYAFCQHQGRPDHICWSKIVQYFDRYRKREVPEYPNNCYDWSSGTQDRITNNDICKNLIRNQSESMPLKALNETNEPKPNKSYCNKDGSMISLDHRPKIPVLGPKSHNLMMGRSFTSICIEKESVLSLNVFDLRPPSPINLSRSIDEALFREHILRDSLFHSSNLQYPSDKSVENSSSSLTIRKTLDQGNVTLGPLEFKRRNSDPDYLYSLAKCSSLNNVQTDTSQQTSQDLEHTQAPSRLHRSASSSSLDSASKTSFGIHWYSWTRNHSSGESVPSADPASESLLPPSKNLDSSEVKLVTEDPNLEAHKSFIEIRVIDDVSLSSDTIEL
ncbi:proline-rich transmembrane protein 3 [Chiloscyllium plagiosum]|uniref:proline-rich transmembrane protein 3 n=1 Tax=Chiloscyllium plagiosum TaxID=36176 RepID=UPI001CB7F049|nr:proline-rich transmembrane protein 3 [Chiloscyllium plagiosum]XP_043563735.1 proline-rich transmembrane protein 3 [Chiloscyllium plagiosum]XP_043563736.1 proline-rich transmembrane protein 3 [Chiloscyllium plagiosum]XP_043563737.1 proline-rich transmembrane protein 3 [Chiloscyllium plagiosum]